MTKKLLICLIGCIFMFSLVGCGEPTSININVENSSELNNTVIGKESLVEIGDKVWYDSTTRVVYWWNGCIGVNNNATAPTPYYAPNGLPYRYNPETNTLEEIGE